MMKVGETMAASISARVRCLHGVGERAAMCHMPPNAAQPDFPSCDCIICELHVSRVKLGSCSCVMERKRDCRNVFQMRRSQLKYRESEVRANSLTLTLVPQWIQWDIFGTTSSMKQEFGPQTWI